MNFVVKANAHLAYCETSRRSFNISLTRLVRLKTVNKTTFQFSDFLPTFRWISFSNVNITSNIKQYSIFCSNHLSKISHISLCGQKTSKSKYCSPLSSLCERYEDWEVGWCSLFPKSNDMNFYKFWLPLCRFSIPFCERQRICVILLIKVKKLPAQPSPALPSQPPLFLVNTFSRWYYRLESRHHIIRVLPFWHKYCDEYTIIIHCWKCLDSLSFNI